MTTALQWCMVMVMVMTVHAASVQPCSVNNFTQKRMKAFILTAYPDINTDPGYLAIKSALELEGVGYDIQSLVNADKRKYVIICTHYSLIRTYFGDFTMYEYDGIAKYSTIILTSFPMTFVDGDGALQNALSDVQLAQLREYCSRTFSRMLLLSSRLGTLNIIPGMSVRYQHSLADNAGTVVMTKLGRFNCYNYTRQPIWTTSEPVYVSSDNVNVQVFSNILRNTRQEPDTAACVYQRQLPYKYDEFHVFLNGDDVSYAPGLTRAALDWAHHGLGISVTCMSLC